MRVWIIGGSKGIGRALAALYAARGDDVLCLARSKCDVEGVRNEPFDLDRPGSEVGTHMHRLLVAEGLDPEDSELRDMVLDDTMRFGWRKRWFYTRRGAPDLAIISSGIGAYIRQDQWRDDWHEDAQGRMHAGIDTIIRINLISRMWIANELLRAMRRRRSGKIVLIGSRVATRGAHALEIYSAGHAGLRGYVYSASRHPAKRGVTLGLIEPGWVDSPMVRDIASHVKSAIDRELGPMMTTDEAAALIADNIAVVSPGQVIEVGR